MKQPNRYLRRTIALESRLAYHLSCRREEATDQDLSGMERLALVRDRAERIREIRQALDTLRRHP